MGTDHTTFQLWRLRNLLALTTILLFWSGLTRERTILIAWAAVQLSFLIGMWLLGAYQIKRLEIRRRLVPGAFEDEAVSAELFVANRGRLPVFMLEIADRFMPAELSHKRILAADPIERGQIASLSYQAHCFKRRGRYEIGPVTLRLSDPLGLFEHKRSLPLFCEFLVYPATIALDRVALWGESPRQAARLVSQNHIGASPSFHGTREYRHGDELRTVHWPTTARRGKLVIKEFDREVARYMTIFLDLEARNLSGLGQKSTVEYSVKIAASLARKTLAGRGLVQLYGAGQQNLFVPPGAGQRQLLRILSALVEVRQDGELPFCELLGLHLRKLPRGSAAVMIFTSANQDEQTVAELLAICRARQVTPLPIVIDQESFLKLREREIGHWSSDDLADALAQWAVTYLVRAEGELAPYFDQAWEHIPVLQGAP